MPKIGVAYNLFDGEELLEKSLRNIRHKVDFLCVIYQVKSNFGEIYTGGEAEVQRCYDLGLLDLGVKYEPVVQYLENKDVYWESGKSNEITKRNLGLEICRQQECDYMLSMDCDEFYDPEQFDYAFKEIQEGNYDTSFCKMRTYYKDVNYELSPPEQYYVPFIHKIKGDTEYNFFNDYPVLVDQTRKVDAGNCLIFDRSEIEMHHYSYVRENIARKFNNSSSVFPKDEINDVIERFDKWKFGNKAILLGNRIYDVKEVEPLKIFDNG